MKQILNQNVFVHVEKPFRPWV